MFTGIIEDIGFIDKVNEKDTNLYFKVQSKLSEFLKVDQSVSHNGVCLTVTEVGSHFFCTVAVLETRMVTNLSQLKEGVSLNLERALLFGSRMDGHLVQGHVDCVGVCTNIKPLKGSWLFSFSYEMAQQYPIVEKGSIAVNGVSLTCFSLQKKSFVVSIIPHTFEHTTFKDIKVGDLVNLEFDLIGKYLQKFSTPYLA